MAIGGIHWNAGEREFGSDQRVDIWSVQVGR